MGSYNRDRELAQLRARYLGATRELDLAMRHFRESGIPLDPGPNTPGSEPYPWTAVHVRVMLRLQAAVAQVIDARRTWDALRREYRPEH